MSLLRALKGGVKNVKRIRFPGTDREIAIRVLSDQDKLDASMATDRLYKSAEIPIGMHNVRDYESEKTTQQLFRACIDPASDTGDRIAESITEFRDLVSGPERAVLIDAYNDHEAECSPDPETLTNEAFDALVAQLKKKPDETIGSISSMSTLRRLCSYLASRPASSPAGSGSTSL